MVSKGKTFGRSAHGAKSFAVRKRRRGAETVRRTVLAWGTLAGGSPARAGGADRSEFEQAVSSILYYLNPVSAEIK